MMKAGGSKYYFATNHLFSVTALTDSTGAVVERYKYDAFGRQIVAPSGANTAVPNDLVFQSNWITASVGAKRYGISPSRVYDFETGRFLQRDPRINAAKEIKSSSGNGFGIYSTTIFVWILQLNDIENSNTYTFLDNSLPNFIDISGLFVLPIAPPQAEAVIGAYIAGELIGTGIAALIEAGTNTGSPGKSRQQQLDDFWKAKEDELKALGPSGDCDEATHTSLQSDVEKACGPESTCKGDMCCDELCRRLKLKQKCLEARDKIDNTCFRGGDEGHTQQRNEVKKGIKNCLTLINNKSCKC